MLVCPKCSHKRFKIIDKSVVGASLLLILVGLISATAIIAAVIIGDVFILGGIVGLGAFIWAMAWMVRKRFVYQCRKCGQKIRANPFGIA